MLTTPTGQKVKKSMKKPRLDDTMSSVDEGEIFDETFGSEDDTSADPDWQKTPLFRRLKELKVRRLSQVLLTKL